MTRDKLDPEEAARRNRECRKRYYEVHKTELAEKQRVKRVGNAEFLKSRREEHHENIKKLVEAGVYSPLKRGRKRLYTPEEAVEVARKQRYESNLRRRERLRAGQLMLESAEMAVNLVGVDVYAQ